MSLSVHPILPTQEERDGGGGVVRTVGVVDVVGAIGLIGSQRSPSQSAEWRRVGVVGLVVLGDGGVGRVSWLVLGRMG